MTVGTCGVYFLLVLVNVVVMMSSKVHMNAVGNVHGVREVLLRLLPQLCLLAFYLYLFLSVSIFGLVRRIPLVLHWSLFALLGLGLAIPFGGLILSELTPVSLLYRLAALHLTTNWAYPTILVLAVLFSALNFGLLLTSLRTK